MNTLTVSRSTALRRIALAVVCSVGLTSFFPISPVLGASPIELTTISSSWPPTDGHGPAFTIRPLNDRIALRGTNQGVEVLDMREPTRPRTIARYRADDGPYQHAYMLATDDERAYVLTQRAHGGPVLTALDLEKPARPLEVARIDVTRLFRASDLVTTNHIVFVAELDASLNLDPRLRAFDFRNPERPIEIDSYRGLLDAASNSVRRLWIRGDTLFALERGSGVWAIDISQPERPRVISRLDIVAGDMAFDGPYMVLLTEGTSLQVWDIEPLGAPRLVSAVELEDPQLQFSSARIAVFGHRVFATSGGGMAVVDIHRPDRPRVVGRSVLRHPVFAAVPDVFQGAVFVHSWFQSDDSGSNAILGWHKVSRSR